MTTTTQFDRDEPALTTGITCRLDTTALTVIAIGRFGAEADLNVEGEPCRNLTDLRDFVEQLIDQGLEIPELLAEAEALLGDVGTLKAKDQILYVPSSVDRRGRSAQQLAQDEPTTEEGFVTSVRQQRAFCRFYRRGGLGLRTVANSEACNLADLVPLTRPGRGDSFVLADALKAFAEPAGAVEPEKLILASWHPEELDETRTP